MPARTAPLKQQMRRTFIREWREYRSLSQDRLVERVREHAQGFSKSTLSRLENCKQAYTQFILEALALALDCTPADLIMRDPGSPVWSIMDTLTALPKAAQQQVAAIVETFKKAS